MVAETKVNVGGAWKTVSQPQVNVGGVWKTVTTIEVNVGGVWKEVWTSTVVVTVSGEIISHSVANGSTARAGLRVNTDGTIDKLEGTTYTQIDASTDWRIPNGSGTGYYVKYTKGLLDPAPTYNPDSITLDTWYEITTSYRIGYEESTNDSEDSGTITAHISDDGGTSTLDTGAFPLTATVGTPI